MRDLYKEFAEQVSAKWYQDVCRPKTSMELATLIVKELRAGSWRKEKLGKVEPI